MPVFTHPLLLACFALSLAPLPAPAQAPEPAPQSAFRPDLFFAGRTRGAGTIITAMSSAPGVCQSKAWAASRPMAS